MSGTYGPLMLLRFGSVPTLVASSSEAARDVMRTHKLAFCSRYLSATLDIISCGGRDILFSPYNDRWRDLRKVCMLELFNPRRVLSFRTVREEEVARLLRSISDQCGGHHAGVVVINLSDGICRMVNDVVVRTAIGDRCKHRDEFLHELDEAVRLTGGFSLADLYPSSRLVRRFSVAARDMGRCQKNVYRIIESIIHERKVAATRVPADRDDDDDLLGVLLRLQSASVGHVRACKEPTGAAQGAIRGFGVTARCLGQKDLKVAVLISGAFGAGRRICPGITHGLANMELVLASLLYHFDWEQPGGAGSGDLDMTEAFGITLKRKSKLMLKAIPRVN
ncbi:unnamed protein product [Miscanthus lutarioriparius]|uniref:Cytochrome P450 n=1 Tax=Miscanthus lutarioriparius TaxID=422564 RepID=A0A811N1Q9_9POAL|nr:unnamed protein product [Miscanthus lutarioriparius]